MYIINSEGIVYHQPEWAVYHQAAGKYTLARDDIQGRNAPLMICTALRAVMIYQACGLDGVPVEIQNSALRYNWYLPLMPTTAKLSPRFARTSSSNREESNKKTDTAFAVSVFLESI